MRYENCRLGSCITGLWAGRLPEPRVTEKKLEEAGEVAIITRVGIETHVYPTIVSTPLSLERIQILPRRNIFAV